MPKRKLTPRFFVAMPDGPEGKTCGHQHKTASKAYNCGGSAYDVIRRPLDDGNVTVEFVNILQ